MASNEELEVKIAFLEDAIATLSEEHFSQQTELRELKTQMDLLVKKVRSLQNSERFGTEAVDEKPPHY